jgi:hypothetical protein
MVGGILVMVGWFWDITTLKSILPQFVAMKFTTAFCFFLSGATLYYIIRSCQEETQVNDLFLIFINFIIILVMASLLLSVFFDIRTGLENLFVSEMEGAINTPVPGRPALLVMLSFMLIASSGLLSLSKKTVNYLIIRIVGVIIMIVGAVAIIGYLLDMPKLYGQFGFISSAVALHTAFLLVLVGLGLTAVSSNFLNKTHKAIYEVTK